MQTGQKGSVCQRTMPTTEAELRIWNRLDVQTKSAAIVAFYIASALFPWISATAVFAFLAGRSCGIKVGKLNAEIEEESRQRMRCRILEEFQKRNSTRTAQVSQTSPTLQPIPESVSVPEQVIEEVIEEEIEEECAEE